MIYPDDSSDGDESTETSTETTSATTATTTETTTSGTVSTIPKAPQTGDAGAPIALTLTAMMIGAAAFVLRKRETE